MAQPSQVRILLPPLNSGASNGRRSGSHRTAASVSATSLLEVALVGAGELCKREHALQTDTPGALDAVQRSVQVRLPVRSAGRQLLERTVSARSHRARPVSCRVGDAGALSRGCAAPGRRRPRVPCEDRSRAQTAQFSQRVSALAGDVGVSLTEQRVRDLYDDRSALVHGADVDLSQPHDRSEFEQGFIALQETLRRTVRRALEEPRFAAEFESPVRITARWPVVVMTGAGDHRTI